MNDIQKNSHVAVKDKDLLMEIEEWLKWLTATEGVHASEYPNHIESCGPGLPATSSHCQAIRRRVHAAIYSAVARGPGCVAESLRGASYGY